MSSERCNCMAPWMFYSTDMLEALLIICAFVLLQWQPFAGSSIIAGILVWLCLPGILVMRGAAPFVTTPAATVRSMLRLAALRPGETAIDLGCGDGRIVIAAAEAGALATGYELSVPGYLLAKARSLFHARCTVRYGNLWRQDYRDADVLFCYFLQGTMLQFERSIWPTLKPGCRVVSHAFLMGSVPVSGRDGDAVLYVKT